MMAGLGNNLLEEDLRQLRQILEPMVEQFVQLQALLLQEQEMLRQRDAAALESLSAQIAEQLAKIRAIDQLRQRVTTQLGKRLGMRPEGLTLGLLDKALGGNSGLQDVRERLRQSIQQADALNRENKAIFSGVLAATESILFALQGGASGPTASYNRLGSRRAHSRFNLLSKQL
ncbi:MAG: flagellar export chaperone FlgN [Magnetococcales bacterium]|nr:flagellar export chaperone FlgN [Magnetococcales bacterium]